jgi:hypothetical protein
MDLRFGHLVRGFKNLFQLETQTAFMFITLENSKVKNNVFFNKLLS